MAKVSTNISIDAEIKAKAQELFADFGMDLSTAINVFLRQAIRENAIPFNIQRKDPNEKTIAAFEEGERLLKDPNALRFSSVDELFEELNS